MLHTGQQKDGVAGLAQSLLLTFHTREKKGFYWKWPPTHTSRRTEDVSQSPGAYGVGLQITFSLALSESHPSTQIFKRQILALGKLVMFFFQSDFRSYL